MHFAFINIIYISDVSFDVDNVKTINGQEVFISVSATLENAKSMDYIFQNYLILALISFSASIFDKNTVLNFSSYSLQVIVVFQFFTESKLVTNVEVNLTVAV